MCSTWPYLVAALQLLCLNNAHARSSSETLHEDEISATSQISLGARSHLPGFKYIYLEEDGQISLSVNSSVAQLEIAGSPLCNELAMRIAADDITKMTQYMPKDIFRRVASSSTVGIFSAQEKIIIFPEYAHYASGACGHSCIGSCSHTCSSDGRKLEDMAGLGGQRAAILEDNLLCTSRDPYYHHLSVLVHEFTHTIHAHGLDQATRHNITLAYQHARQNHTWAVNSYAMYNEREYLAVATTVFFGVNRNGLQNSGGMNQCGAGRMCQTEQQGRAHLREKDPGLFEILAYVFTSNNVSLASSLTTCPVYDVNATIVG